MSYEAHLDVNPLVPRDHSCVYIAPHDSLARDVTAAWRSKFGEGLGVEVVGLTGDTAADLKLLERGNVVVATPQQWDVMSRRWVWVGCVLAGGGAGGVLLEWGNVVVATPRQWDVMSRSWAGCVEACGLGYCAAVERCKKQ